MGRFKAPSPALVIAGVALFSSLGGGAVATVALNQVVSSSIKDGEVKRPDIANGAVTSAKIANGQVQLVDISTTARTGLVANYYNKTQSDDRYMRGTITVTAKSAPIAKGAFGYATATCPTGMQAIGGGANPSGVLNMVVSGSFAVISGRSPGELSVGRHPAATGWRAFAKNVNQSGTAIVTAVVVCAPLG
jgi:hypothetical protein